MKDLIIDQANTIIGDQVNAPILSIATDYIISIALGYLNHHELPRVTLPIITKAVISEYDNMILEDKHIKTYSAGDISLNFSDKNLTQHLLLLQKDLFPFRKMIW